MYCHCPAMAGTCARLVPGHRPGPKQRSVGRSGRLGRSGRSIMIQPPICLFRSGQTLSHPIPGELSVRTSLWVSARPRQKNSELRVSRQGRSLPYRGRMAQGCNYPTGGSATCSRNKTTGGHDHTQGFAAMTKLSQCLGKKKRCRFTMCHTCNLGL